MTVIPVQDVDLSLRPGKTSAFAQHIPFVRECFVCLFCLAEEFNLHLDLLFNSNAPVLPENLTSAFSAFSERSQ